MLSLRIHHAFWAWTIRLAVVIGFRNSASLLQIREGRGAKAWGGGGDRGAVHLLVILYILCNNKLVIYYIQQLMVCVCVIICITTETKMYL